MVDGERYFSCVVGYNAAGLASNTEYYVRVLAYNSKGFSQPCAVQGSLCEQLSTPVKATTA